MTHCRCTPTRRKLHPTTGICMTCRVTVHETDIMHLVRATLIADPRCLLWRNEIGSSTHFPDGTPRRGPIKYGVANPGGADLIGLYGGQPSERDAAAAVHSPIIHPRSTFLAVEVKTVRGRQNPDQLAFERCVLTAGGVYALCRSADDAADLLRHLQSGDSSPLPIHLRGGGHL